MKTLSVQGRSNAFTLLEVCVVISTIALVTLLILPSMARPNRSGARKINCSINLKQIGLAFRMWADDNANFYPMQFRTNGFDGPSFAIQQKLFVYFQVMSNELNTPKILVCPDDTKRTFATNFATDFDNSKVSYFVGLDADETYPNMFLAGDSHITNGTKMLNHLLDLKTNQPISWTQEIHNGQGNVGLADGSVQGFTSTGLQMALEHTGTNLTRLAMP